MNIGAFVSKRKNDSAPSSRPRQKQLSFGPPKNDSRGIYLTNEELHDWSKNYALSDREAGVIENAVHGCVRPSPLLGVKRLQGEKPLRDSSVAGQRVSNSQNMTLSLGRWVHLLNAPFIPKFLKPSSRSKQLCSLLESIEVLQSGSQAGEEYDLEMNTFLNMEDVCESPEKVMEEGLVGGTRRRRPVVLSDSSDDEDFNLHRPSVGRLQIENEVEPESVENTSDKTNSISYSPASDSTLPLSPAPSSRPPIDSSLIAVPKPPSMDTLDWLDSMNVTPAHNPSAHTASSTNTASGKEQFVSPKNCLNSRFLRKQQHERRQSPKLWSPGEKPQTPHSSDIDSCEEPADNLDGISLSELLDDDLSDAENEIAERESEIRDIRKESALSTATTVATSSCSTSHIVSAAVTPTTKCVRVSKSPSPSLLSPSPAPNRHLPISTPDSEEKFLNARIAPSRRLRSNRRLPFLLTQESPSAEKAHPSPQKRLKTVGPSREPPRKPAVHDFSSDEDDFMVPLMKRLKRNETDKMTATAAVTPSLSPEGVGLIEDQAEVSGSDEDDANSNTSLDSYDCDDSFINDTSVLTQEISHDTSCPSPANVTSMYRQSLMSPTGGFAKHGRRGHGNQYRLVMSQRYKLLNHYINKAGLKVSASARKRSRPARTEVLEESEAEEVMEHCSESDLSSEGERDVDSMEEGGMGEQELLSELEEERDDEVVMEGDAGVVAAISSRAVASMKENKIVISPSLLVR